MSQQVFDLFASTYTLAEARRAVTAGLDDGVECPCCGQFAKVYKRKLNSFMAYALIVLRNHAVRSDNQWVHIRALSLRVAAGGGELAKLCHWDLIEEMPAQREDGSRHAGFYRITARGLSFVNGETSVPRHVFIYDNGVRGFSDERTTIREALGDKFNYSELMALSPPLSERRT